jgi:hypothetical protein
MDKEGEEARRMNLSIEEKRGTENFKNQRGS